MRTPDATLLQQETVNVHRLTTGLRTAGDPSGTSTYYFDEGQITGWSAHPSEAFVGTDFVISGPDTLWGAPGYWFRGDEYIAQHRNLCLWQVNNREELVNHSVALIRVMKTMASGLEKAWLMAANSLLTADQVAAWLAFDLRLPDVITSVDGHPYYGAGGTIQPNDRFVSLRDIIPRLTCYWLPLFAERDDVTDEPLDIGTGNLLPYGVMSLINTFRDHDPSTWPNANYLYKPSALDLAASATLSPGFLFGVELDPRSPLYGEFLCFEGGVYLDGGLGEDGAADPVIQSTPWALQSGDVIAEFGVVNRFTRTTDDESLPAWIELELIRI